MPLPDILAPGVYINEIPSPSPSIEGVSTSTTAFVGPTLTAPAGPPPLVTSLSQYQTLYGDASQLTFSNSQPVHNYMWAAARAFFDNGGLRLFVSQIPSPPNGPPITPADYRAALLALEPIPNISIVAAPGSTIFAGGTLAQATAVHAELIAHVSRPAAYRFAVLDPTLAATTADIQSLRAQINSPYAAIYYPFVAIANPNPHPGLNDAQQILVPPSGFVCGIYVRTDTNIGVSKAPANQTIIGSLALERAIADPESTTLNDAGISTLRTFPGKGNLVWGARTTSLDPDWRYVNVRRFFSYVESSIDKGLQWAVFQPNDTLLWAAVTAQISNFLSTEWRRGSLQGTTPAEAFFAKCDRTTMTQTDIDNGRLICLVGMAPLKPAEFVIFRIQIQTATATNPNP